MLKNPLLFKLTLLSLFLGLGFVSFCGLLEAKDLSKNASQREYSFVQSGDQAFEEYDFESALKHYKKAFKQNPKGYSIICRLSKTYTEYGLGQNKESKGLTYFKKAKGLAKKAVNLSPNEARGYLCLAYALGSISLRGDLGQKLKSSKEIPKYVNKALDLNPDLDLAWYILGSWHRRIAALDGFEKFLASMAGGDLLKTASTEKAVQCQKKAIDLNPRVIAYHLGLGSALEDLKKYDQAANEYRKALGLPARCNKHKMYQEKANEELGEILAGDP